MPDIILITFFCKYIQNTKTPEQKGIFEHTGIWYFPEIKQIKPQAVAYAITVTPRQSSNYFLT